jgi:hypothetical protein
LLRGRAREVKARPAKKKNVMPVTKTEEPNTIFVYGYSEEKLRWIHQFLLDPQQNKATSKAND